MILLYMFLGSLAVGTLASLLFVAWAKLLAEKIYWNVAVPFFFLYFAMGAVFGGCAYEFGKI